MTALALRLSLPVVLLLLAASAGATMAVRLELPALTQHSSSVVIARVQAAHARWDEQRAGIWTHYTLSVRETLKGAHRAAREVVIRGGVVGDIGQHVAGAGGLEVGQEYVLFTWRDSAGRERLTGMVQGALRVENGRARNSFAGLTLVDPVTLQPVALERRMPLDLTLDELRAGVRAAARQEGER
jgi:hypothetical protein